METCCYIIEPQIITNLNDKEKYSLLATNDNIIPHLKIRFYYPEDFIKQLLKTILWNTNVYSNIHDP